MYYFTTIFFCMSCVKPCTDCMCINEVYVLGVICYELFGLQGTFTSSNKSFVFWGGTTGGTLPRSGSDILLNTKILVRDATSSVHLVACSSYISGHPLCPVLKALHLLRLQTNICEGITKTCRCVS